MPSRARRRAPRSWRAQTHLRAPPWPRGLALGPLVFASLSLPCAGRAHAYEVEADATVTGQGYELRTADPAGTPAAQRLVDRRRLTTYLGLRLSGLGAKDADGLPTARNQFGATFQMRFDADFGDFLCDIGRAGSAAPLGCRDRAQGGVSTRPELGNYRPEILAGYVEGTDLGGFADLRIGRQIQWELFDLRALDGVWAEARTPLYTAVELWGGLSVSGALPIDSPVYVLDGTSRSPASEARGEPQQSEALQPTVGFALRTYGLRDVQARLSYRRTFSLTALPAAAGCPPRAPGSSVTAACAPGLGTIEERLSYTAFGRILDGKLQGYGGLRYDFVSGRFDDGHAGVRGSLAPRHTLAAEYRYSAPTWDGDSIWNVFSAEPYHNAELRYDGRMHSGYGDVPSRVGDVQIHASAFARVFRTSTPAPGAKTSDEAGALAPAYGGRAGVRFDRRSGFVRIDAYCDGGYGGLRAGGDVSGRLLFFRNQLGLEGRAIYLYWADDQRAANTSHSGTFQAGVRWSAFRGALVHLFAEESISRFDLSRLRLMVSVDLSFLLGPHGRGVAPAGLLGAGMGAFPTPLARPEVL